MSEHGHTSDTKIAKLALEAQLDGNWSSFQLAKSTPPQSVIDRANAPSARMLYNATFHIHRVSKILQEYFKHHFYNRITQKGLTS